MNNFDKETLLSTEIVSTAASDSSNLVGSTLADRYYVERKLGEGGIGAVYLARDKPELMSRKVVVKVLQEKALGNEWIVTKFRQEIEALTRIDDPGVVGILDAGNLANGHPFLVMEFVEGENLRAHMRPDRGMEFEDIAHIMLQVGRTLSAAHTNEVIHRDLKPENIMVRRRSDNLWQVKVIDFGIAKVRNSVIAPSTMTGQVAGTAYYMSPEQLQGKKVSAASDVYALGIIAYEMVTGRRPFTPETPFQLVEMQQAGVQVMPKALRPAVPVHAQDSILKALSLQPSDRHQSAAEFANYLAKALLDQRTIPAVEETKPLSFSTTLPALNEPQIIQPVGPSETDPRLKKYAVLAVVVLVLVTATLSMFAYMESKARRERGLTYWLTVQRMYDGKPLGQPFQATGKDYFHTGDKFALNFSANDAGALYIINQSRDAQGAPEWNILFPTDANNARSSLLASQQTVKTGDYVFGGSWGVETLWIVWADQPDPLLDSIFSASFQDGVIQVPAQIQLQEFFNQHNKSTGQLEFDEANSRVSLKRKEEIVVRRIDLSHRPN